MLAVTKLIRILLFLKPNERASWEKDRLRQRHFEVDGRAVVDWDRCTGIQSHYPLRGNDMFQKDWFRFIDLQNGTVGDVYVSFDLHEIPKKEKLFVVPDKNSGGIDFTSNEKFIKNDDTEGKADLRWFPQPLPKTFRIEKPAVITYIVIHHPEDVCDTMHSGKTEIDTEIFHIKGDPPIECLSDQHRLFLTGNEARWCGKQFMGEDKTLGVREFFRFIGE